MDFDKFRLVFWCQDGKGFPVITFNLILGPVIVSEAQNLQRNGCRNGGLAKVEKIRCLFFDTSDCHKIGKKKLLPKFFFVANIHPKRTIAS